MIDDQKSVTPLIQLAEDCGISMRSLNDKIKSMGITLIFRRPKNISIWVSGLAIVPNEINTKTFKGMLNDEKGTPFSKEHSHCVELDDDIKFLPIDISDWMEISTTGEVLKRSFKQAFTYSHSRGLEKISATEKLKSHFRPSPALVVEADFFITSKLGGTHPTEVSVTERQVLIGNEDAQIIIKEKHQKKERPREEWMSGDLHSLNEASDIFIAQKNITKENRGNTIEEVKDWLSNRFSNSGGDLLHQASLSILPDEFYENSPHKITDERITSKYPPHASTSLIKINEAAIYFWNELSKSAKNKYPKKDYVLKILTNDDWGLSRRLATAVYTIINKSKKDHQ